MLRQNISLFFIVLLLFSTGFSAVNTEDEKLMEELSGKVKAMQPVKNIKAVAATISEQHLFAGLDAFTKKNYIMALKHFNTVILKHSQSKEVRSAYLAKAKLYNEIGLKDQAQLNSQLAFEQGKKLTK